MTHRSGAICGCGFDPRDERTTSLCDGRCNGPSHRDRLDMLRRDLLMLRHDVAREMGENGRDYITRTLDTAGAALEVEIQYAESKEGQR